MNILAETIKVGLRGLIHISTLGQKRGTHITRFYMYKHLQTVIESWPREGKVLAIGNSR